MKAILRQQLQRLYLVWVGMRWRPLRAALTIQSHLTAQERVALYRLARSASTIAEIGSYIGASACCFGAARAQAGHGSIVCIDTWQNDAMSEGQRDTWQEFRTNTGEFAEYIAAVRGFSTEVLDMVRELAPTLDLLFIDGDHSYAGVKADWETYKRLLKPGSIVIFHDFGWADGVRRVVLEDVLPVVASHQSLPNMWWGTLAERA